MSKDFRGAIQSLNCNPAVLSNRLRKRLLRKKLPGTRGGRLWTLPILPTPLLYTTDSTNCARDSGLSINWLCSSIPLSARPSTVVPSPRIYLFTSRDWRRLATTLPVGIDVCTHLSNDASWCQGPRLLRGSREDLEQPAVWSPLGIIFVHVQATAQDTTFYEKLSRQLSPHMTNRFRPVPRIPSVRLTSLGVLAVILTWRQSPPKPVIWW